LFRTLLAVGLVDELSVNIIPVLLGTGIPLLPPPTSRMRLKLTKHRIYEKTGTVGLDYDILGSTGRLWPAPDRSAKDGVQIVLHFGAKKRDDTPSPDAIADPESLLVWPAEDRATATFRSLADVEAKRSAFTDVIREWIRYV